MMFRKTGVPVKMSVHIFGCKKCCSKTVKIRLKSTGRITSFMQAGHDKNAKTHFTLHKMHNSETSPKLNNPPIKCTCAENILKFDSTGCQFAEEKRHLFLICIGRAEAQGRPRLCVTRVLIHACSNSSPRDKGSTGMQLPFDRVFKVVLLIAYS